MSPPLSRVRQAINHHEEGSEQSRDFLWTTRSCNLDGGEWSASRPCRFAPGKRAFSIHWIGGQVDQRAGMDTVDNRKIWPPVGNRTPVVQPVARRYTDSLTMEREKLFKAMRGRQQA
jgi:hypothetical protein